VPQGVTSDCHVLREDRHKLRRHPLPRRRPRSPQVTAEPRSRRYKEGFGQHRETMTVARAEREAVACQLTITGGDPGTARRLKSAVLPRLRDGCVADLPLAF
jgi:hypothetical protein